jgi:hypothetical protein
MTGMNEKQYVLRGREASAVLENEAFKAAISGLKSTVMDQWKNCPIRDHEGQVLLLQLAKLTDKFESILVGMIENGKLAQNRIELNEIRDESASRRMLRRVTG